MGKTAYALNCHHLCLFFTPLIFLLSCTPVHISLFLLRFLWFTAQKTVSTSSTIFSSFFGVQRNFLYIFHYFCKKSKIPYSRNVKLQSGVFSNGGSNGMPAILVM